MGYIYFSSI